MLKNKTLGSALIIAGTSIGAGMLAIPLTSAGIGFGYTVLLLVGLWAILSYSGLLFVEVYQTAEYLDDGVATLAEKYFGVLGRALATFSLLILLYALSAAYITGGGSLLAGLPTAFGGEPLELKTAILLFTLVLGSFVVIGTKGVDGATRMLFIGKLIAFAFVLFMMLPKVKVDNLLALPLDYAFVISAAPIFFTSFGFHIIMGSVNKYLDGSVAKFRRAILIGTSIPLVAYLVWQLSTHGVLSQNEFVQILKADPTLNGLVNALFYPEGFIKALGYAGLLCAFYCLILPIGLAWRTRVTHPNLPYRVAGGYLTLILALLVGLLIMAIPFLIQAGKLPAVVG